MVSVRKAVFVGEGETRGSGLVCLCVCIYYISIYIKVPAHSRIWFLGHRRLCTSSLSHSSFLRLDHSGSQGKV
ncbi:hypothetical protein scyTo_0008715 [Scyliorhinus torazame]|uniref:Uncharacterized protein n=1 Tax=Scyliorhinus torazame TaxID=75743 RepID=A0A401PCR1_SCYTO|nr:hypothetical protein [Scyliorhinus torazame]